MKKSKILLLTITLSLIVTLACSAVSIPSLATQTPQTLVTVPPVPTSIPTQAEETGKTELENENLLVTVPEGFKIDYEAEQNGIRISEMVPEGESVNDWSTMVSVQIFLGQTELTPEEAQSILTESWFGACPDSTTVDVADGEENGYAFRLWQLFCPVNPTTQKVEWTYMKGIQGNDSFYLVQVAFRHDPSDDEITQWASYLKNVQVCDSRIAERACP